MTGEELAVILNGREYGNEISHAESAAAKAAGLVVVYGASDDLVEFAGAIEDEVGAYGGKTLRVNREGLMPDWGYIDHQNEKAAERYFRLKALPSSEIKAIWGAEGISWTYLTHLPHATFDIYEDGEVFCRGIVFRLADVGRPEGAGE